MPLPLILFDDDSPWLSPLNDLRPTFNVRTGAMTTMERWGAMAGSIGAALLGVRPSSRLGALTREVAGDRVVDGAKLPAGDVLFVNARCVLPFAGLSAIAPNSAVVQPGPGASGSTTVVAARFAGDLARAFFESLTLPVGVATTMSTEAKVLHRPWDVIRHRDACLDADLAHLTNPSIHPNPAPQRKHGASPASTGVTFINESAIHVHESARISPGVILDAEGGPIVIDEGATVRHGTIIIGPASIGKHSTILERGLIKAHTAIGPVCKVTGEVGGTIFQGHANKGHDGHLGDSWVGEWANFGAGTTNSNLLNTYADVIATAMQRRAASPEDRSPGGPALPAGIVQPSRERTGIQYLGCIVGDHTKFAICTRIMTGSVFGTGCMVATTAAPPTCVPAFSWLTDERTQAYRFSKFLEVAKAVMARRKIVPGEAYVEAMRALA